MSELIVIATDTIEDATALRDEIARMARDFAVEIEDVVVVTRDATGDIALHPPVNSVAAQAVGGTVWGLGLGAIFLMPLIGAAVGAAAGALTGKFTAVGIDDAFLTGIGARLSPGRAAVALLARRADPDRLAALLAPHEGAVLRATLSQEVAARMPDWLDAEPPRTGRSHVAGYRDQPTL